MKLFGPLLQVVYPKNRVMFDNLPPRIPPWRDSGQGSTAIRRLKRYFECNDS